MPQRDRVNLPEPSCPSSLAAAQTSKSLMRINEDARVARLAPGDAQLSARQEDATVQPPRSRGTRSGAKRSAVKLLKFAIHHLVTA